MLNLLIVCLTGVLFLIIPSVSIDYLMNGTQSGKTFVFLYGITGIGALSFIQFIFQKNYRYLKISYLDILLFVWVVYIFANGFIQEIPFSLRILELAGLVVLYAVLRQIQLKYYPFLFLALMLGGLFQAVYGNMQLWGYYPSHHGLYKMTGSFFNPGPYAGYLAGILPVALGAYLLKIKFLSTKQEKAIFHQIDKIKIIISQLIRKGIKYFPEHTNSPKDSLAEKHQTKPDQHAFVKVLFYCNYCCNNIGYTCFPLKGILAGNYFFCWIFVYIKIQICFTWFIS